MSVALGVRWSEVQPLPTLLPEGDYQFRLLGGKAEGDGRTTVATAIGEGEFTGKKFTYSYPNFAEQEWGINEFKRLVIALGEDIQDEEEPADYLNRVAGGTFAMRVFHSAFKDKTTGEDRKSAKPRLSSVRPA